MIVLMVFATCYGIMQLAVLGSAARSVRLSTLLLAAATGCYACGLVALLGEIGYTRAVAASGDALYQVVTTASYTIDPVIEEIAKVIPLIVMAVLIRRFGRQWGLTDFLLVGASVGAGFALLEAMLRFSSSASRAIPDGKGGFILPLSLFPPHIEGFGQTLASWLPPPVESLDFLGMAGSGVNLHLAWTALTGLGLGLLVRFRGWRRLVGLLPLCYASVDHAVSNYSLNRADHGFAGVIFSAMRTARDALPLLVFLALVATVILDVRILERLRRAHPELLMTAERRPGAESRVALARFAALAPPWTATVAVRFLLMRRAAWLALTGPSPNPKLAGDITALCTLIDAAGDQKRWQEASRTVGVRLVHPAQWLQRWPVLAWLLLLLPVLVYFVLGGVPTTAGLQKAMQTTAGLWVAGAITLLGLAYGCWQLIKVIQLLPRQVREAWCEGMFRTALRVLVGTSAVAGGLCCLALWLTGFARYGRVITNFHVLDALGSALLVAALLLLLAGLIMMFPPGGALVLAGGGTLVASAASALVVLKAAAVLGIAGVVLMAASRGGGGYGDDGGKRAPQRGGTPRGPKAQNKQFADAVREAERKIGRELDDDEIQRVHREISHQGYGYHEIVELIIDMFG